MLVYLWCARLVRLGEITKGGTTGWAEEESNSFGRTVTSLIPIP